MKSMIRTQFTFALLCLFSSAVYAQLQGDTFTNAKSTKKATWVITHSDSPGLATINAAGKQEGVCFDIMTEFANYVKSKTGIEVTMKYQTVDANDFTAFLKNVKDGKGGVFGLSNTTITDERKKTYHFSPPFIKNVSMILSNSSVPDLTDFKSISTSFAGMKAITIKGSTNEARLLDIKKKYYPAMVVEYVPSFAKAIDRIASDPKTFTCQDFTYYLKAVQAGKQIKRHAIGDEDGEEFGIIMPLSNDWNPLLTEFMNSGFTTSVQFNKIITNHLGQSVLKFIKKQ